jgi:aminomethyltransferase
MNKNSQTENEPVDALRTPLHALHQELSGKLVPFAGYEMPVQYPMGILKEHLHTRTVAGLFDVSHMGQAELRGAGAAALMETLVPGDICGLVPGTTRYTQLTTDRGGILDDLMVTNGGDRLLLVVNAVCKAEDIAHIRVALPSGIELVELPDRALIAVQGPASASLIETVGEGKISKMPFMSYTECVVADVACRVWRSGYTGEDGYEISCKSSDAEALARRLLALDGVAPIGLGARNSLRLEAGLCLYGHDIDQTTTPIEAGLLWSISKRRRDEGQFPGASIIQNQITDGVTRRRVGIKPEGRMPMREHTKLFDNEGALIGEVTSGGFGPSVGGPIAMGYVETRYAKADTLITAEVRGKMHKALVVRLPFVEQRYYRS